MSRPVGSRNEWHGNVVIVEERPRRRSEYLSPAQARRHEIKRQVAITVLMRQGLTYREAEEQFEYGPGSRRQWRR